MSTLTTKKVRIWG